MIWRICTIDTAQSHVFNCRMFCILISKVILTSCCFCLPTVVLMPFVVRIGFESCNNYTLSCSCRFRLFTFVARCCASYHGYFSLDPFFSIVASLKAMQCNKLRAKGRLVSAVCFVIAPLSSVTGRFVLRELSIFLLCFDYVLWPGAASSPSAVSKFCSI